MSTSKTKVSSLLEIVTHSLGVIERNHAQRVFNVVILKAVNSLNHYPPIRISFFIQQSDIYKGSPERQSLVQEISCSKEYTVSNPS